MFVKKGQFFMIKNEIGKVYGYLTVIDRAPNNKYGQAMWKCRCICGKEVEVFGRYLRIGHTKSCGCKKAEMSREGNTTHGMRDTITYTTWLNVKQRCLNPNSPNYSNYGGRGIKICQEWIDSFEQFVKDMGERPNENYSLDRIDYNGNYEPSNCRWANIIQQANNTRKNVYLEYNGKKMSASDWGRELNINPSTIIDRKKRGWSDEKSLTTPTKKIAVSNNVKNVWTNIKQLCYNTNHPRYKDYGGRGLTVCEEWLNSFDSFYRDMGNKTETNNTLCRRDVNVGFTKDNCFWGTREQSQQSNRTIRILNVNGESHSMAEWAKIKGIDERVIFDRLKLGWTEEKAVNTPVKQTLTITYDGQTKSISEWSKLMQIPTRTLRHRKQSNWTDEECILGKKH